LKWTEAAAACATLFGRDVSDLSGLPQQKQRQYQAELNQKLQAFEQERVHWVTAVHGLSYGMFVSALGTMLDEAEDFPEKKQLLNMTAQLKFFLQAQQDEQQAGLVLQKAERTHAANTLDLAAQKKTLEDNREKVIPGLQVAIKQGEDALPGYRLQMYTYQAKKWLYWGLAALAVAAITLPVIALVFGSSEILFLISLPLALVSLFTPCCFLAAGANNRDKEVTSRRVVAQHEEGLTQNKTKQREAGQEVIGLRESIPRAGDTCQASFLSLQTQVAAVDAYKAQTQGYYQQAKELGFFKPDVDAGAEEMKQEQVVAAL
jgi:hypothetical protein